MTYFFSNTEVIKVRLFSMYTFHWVMTVFIFLFLMLSIILPANEAIVHELSRLLSPYKSLVIAPVAILVLFIFVHWYLMIRDCFRMKSLDTRFAWIFIMVFASFVGSAIFFLRNRKLIKETFLY